MICPTCNKEFSPRAVNQIYCSRKCERHAMKMRYFNRDEPTAPINARPIDEFICKNCGKTVDIYDRFDKRTVYCSRACERKFWREQSKRKNRNGNIGLSGGMSLQSLIRRERRDLD